MIDDLVPDRHLSSHSRHDMEHQYWCSSLVFRWKFESTATRYTDLRYAWHTLDIKGLGIHSRIVPAQLPASIMTNPGDPRWWSNPLGQCERRKCVCVGPRNCITSLLKSPRPTSSSACVHCPGIWLEMVRARVCDLPDMVHLNSFWMSFILGDYWLNSRKGTLRLIFQR